MRWRTRQGRLSYPVLVVLAVYAALVAQGPQVGPVWADYQGAAPSTGVAPSASMPIGPERALGSWAAPPTPCPESSLARSSTLGATESLTPTSSYGAVMPSTAPTHWGTPTIISTMAPTPTHAAADTPAPTATPSLRPIQMPIFLSQRDLIVNGTFESGQLEPYWGNVGTLRRKVVSTVRYSGLYSALLGDPAYRSDGGCPTGAAAIYQVVEVPRTGQATLRFWYLIQSYDTRQFDYLAVIVASTPDLAKPPVFSQGRTYWDQWLWSSGWREAKISLSPFKGETVYIMLCNVMGNDDGWYNTWTYVDDVRIDYRP